MIREKATAAEDMPHAATVKPRGYEDGKCAFCERAMTDELHDPELRVEKASAREVLKRETGS